MEVHMAKKNKQPLDILDDIYSLSYWMTKNQEASTQLVNETYQHAACSTRESDLLKTFRQCYLERYGEDAGVDMAECGNGRDRSRHNTARRWSTDIKLSVLLSEISGLKHRQISEIMEKPLRTIRLWLLWGRSFLEKECLLRASA